MGSATQRGSPPKTPVQRRPLHERSHSATNTQGIRIVPYSPQRLSSDQSDNVYSRSPLPTHPAHILSPTEAGAAIERARQGSALDAYHEQFGDRDDVSAYHYPAKSQAMPGSSVTITHQTPQTVQLTAPKPSEATQKAKPLLPKKRKHVAVNPDNKTFRILDLDQQDEHQIVDEGQKSPRSFQSVDSPPASQTSHDPITSGVARGVDTSVRSSSSCQPGSTAATTPTSVGTIKTPPLADDHITSSPWNYRLIGGVRKVPKTPDLKHQTVSGSDLPPETSLEPPKNKKAAPDLSTKASFQSAATTDSALSSNISNYEVYGSSPSLPHPITLPNSSSEGDLQSLLQLSPDLHCKTSPDTQSEAPSNANYQILGESSPAGPTAASELRLEESPTASTSDLGDFSNYHILGCSSPVSSELELSSLGNYHLQTDVSSSISQVALSPHSARHKYSRESLIVPPLQPRSRRSTEQFGYYKQRSRESLRAGSLTSISSVLSQEGTRSVLSNPSIVHLPSHSTTIVSSSWTNPLALHPARSHMQAHPHQWSSQLSTVPSESDGGTDRGSRSFSDVTRRVSGFLSEHSRHRPSISSQHEKDQAAREDSLEYPQPAFVRNSQRDATGSTIRIVEDQDEYGDGLTDMPGLRPRPSRNRLADFYSFASDTARTNTMRSTSSSRANSLLASSIPTWARLYYGSGERRYLGMNASTSEISSLSRASSRRSGSPDTSNFPLSLYSPRRRPRDINPNSERTNRGGSMDISPLPELGDNGRLTHGPYKRQFRTSSIWSPHLGTDRRTHSKRMSVWDGVPSITLSTESGLLGKRNRQLLLFIAGFIFPFAWMIASFLPIPAKPMFLIRERDGLTAISDMPESMAKEFRPMDEARYESAHWWRTLNRGMSVLGILVIAVVIILLVLGITRRWT